MNAHSPLILGGRQVDAKAAAATFCRQANRIAAVTTCDFADQGKTEPAAVAALPRRSQAIEGLEDTFAFVRWHARSVVAYFEHRATCG